MLVLRSDVWFGGLYSPYRRCTKNKTFLFPNKKIGNFTFAKITKFTTFSKEKLLCSKVHLTSKDNRERFSTTKNWIFRLQLPKTGIFDFCKNSKYRKMVKNCFYRSLRKVESFPFFFTVFKVFCTDFISHIPHDRIFDSSYSNRHFRSPTAQNRDVQRSRNLLEKTKFQKTVFIGILEKFQTFRFSKQFSELNGTTFKSTYHCLLDSAYLKESLLGSVLFM